MLRLADLSHLPRPGATGADWSTFERECLRSGLNWPPLVVEQFLFDHGNKPEFLDQYDHLDLLTLEWQLRAVPAAELIRSTFDSDLGGRVHQVADGVHNVLDQYRETYGDVWTTSWNVPPVMIEGSLRNPPQRELHLVEGHTRLGVLVGLVNFGEISLGSIHEVLLASHRK